MSKRITRGDDARQAIMRGIDSLANAVKVTLGPRGRNVILETPSGSPAITKDGATVAREIVLRHPLENLGAQMVAEVAAKTADTTGDGTTTATVLAQAIYREGVKNLAAGANPMELKRGIDAAVAAIVGSLAQQAQPVTSAMIAQVGAIAANGDEAVGRLLADTLERVGKEGVVTIEESQTVETTVDIVEGMQFERGYLSPYFVTDAERMEAVLERPFVLVHEGKIRAIADLLPLLEKAAASGRPLLIIAEDVEADVLATLVVNKLRGTLPVAAVKAPGFGDRRKAALEDIAVMTGGRAITEDLGVTLQSVALEDLGTARRITISRDRTTIIEGGGTPTAVAARLTQLRVHLERAESDYDREKLREQIATLAGGVAVIRVGATTESEQKERKARVEDAIHAARAAVEEGVVPGGGVALLRASAALDGVTPGGDRQVGVRIVRRAIEEPLRWIAANGGHEPAVVVERVRMSQGGVGFNAQSEVYENLFDAGVIDPVKVVRVALQNAASVASLLLTMEAAISQEMPAAG